MKKQLPISLLILLTVICATAQSDYFEVHTKSAHNQPGSGFLLNRDSILAQIQNMPDTTSTLATFVISANNPAEVDSVFFTLSDSQEQTVYAGALDYASISASPSFRVVGNTIYFTVGPYPYLKQFAATGRVKYANGSSTSIRSFDKN